RPVADRRPRLRLLRPAGDKGRPAGTALQAVRGGHVAAVRVLPGSRMGGSRAGTGELTLPFPDDLVYRIAQRAAEPVLRRLPAATQGRWMTVREAADYARCSVQHVYDLRSDGRLGRHGGRGHALVDRRELDALLDNSRL